MTFSEAIEKKKGIGNHYPLTNEITGKVYVAPEDEEDYKRYSQAFYETIFLGGNIDDEYAKQFSRNQKFAVYAFGELNENSVPYKKLS